MQTVRELVDDRDGELVGKDDKVRLRSAAGTGSSWVTRRWPLTLAGPSPRMSIFPLPALSRHASLFDPDKPTRFEVRATTGE